MHAYLLFHSLAEIVAATVNFGTFLFAWTTRRHQNGYLLTLGTAALFVGLFEALHCVAFPGMPVFPLYDDNLSPQLWLSARLFQAGAAVGGVLLVDRRVRPGWLLGGLAAAFALLCTAVFRNALPAVVAQPGGLTAFKIAAEWVLAWGFLTSAWLLFRVRARFSRRVFRLLVAHGVVMAACDVCFTLYLQPEDPINLLGHVLLLAGVGLQYFAILRAGLIEPGDTHFRQLTEAKARLERAQSAARIATFEFDLSTDTVTTTGMEPLVGGRVPQADVAGWLAPVHPDDRGRLQRLLMDAVAGRERFDAEYRVVWPDGSVHSLAVLGRLEHDEHGRAIRLVGVTMDVSERKRVEAVLRDREEQLRLFIEHAPAALAMFDREMRYLSVSRRWLSDYRLEGRNLRGLSHYEVFPEIGDEWKAVHRRALRGEVVSSEADRFLRRDGTVQWQQWEVRPWFETGGAIGGILIFTEDVTERRRADAALRDSEVRFRLALRNAPVSVSAQDRDLRYIWAFNQRTVRPEQLIGKTDAEVVTGEEAERLTAIKRRVLEEGIELREQMWFERPTGRSFFDICVEPIRDEAGQVVGVATATVDQTALKRAEEMIRDADKHKSEFLAILSHELRNPLAPIVSGLFVLEHSPADSPQGVRARAVIRRQVDQLARLVDDLLDVTRIGRNKIRLQRERLEVNDLVRRVVEDHRALFDAAQVGLELKQASAPCFIVADRSRIAQVVGNLLQNAAKFTPSGGQVVVTVAAMPADRGHGTVEVRVADTGVGLDAEALPSMFQPFAQAEATLDRTKGGLGLGLSLVKGLAELHGGCVRAHSDGPGRGSEFVVTLPSDGASLEYDGGDLAPPAATRRKSGSEVA